MYKPSIKIVEQLQAEFTDFFIHLAEKKQGDFHIALSGGNTPKNWFDYLGTHLAKWPGWKKMHFYWGDERCVPPNDPQSNFGMTDIHLFSKIRSVNRKHIHRIKGEIDPNLAAAKYEGLLKRNLPTIDGKPGFDLVMLGVGEDGHTASIFPDQIKLWHDPKWCVVARHPESGQHRVSLNANLINHSANVCFLVQGASKAKISTSILKNIDRAEYPATLVDPSNGNLFWFMDPDAGKLWSEYE